MSTYRTLRVMHYAPTEGPIMHASIDDKNAEVVRGLRPIDLPRRHEDEEHPLHMQALAKVSERYEYVCWCDCHPCLTMRLSVEAKTELDAHRLAVDLLQYEHAQIR